MIFRLSIVRDVDFSSGNVVLGSRFGQKSGNVTRNHENFRHLKMAWVLPQGTQNVHLRSFEDIDVHNWTFLTRVENRPNLVLTSTSRHTPWRGPSFWGFRCRAGGTAGGERRLRVRGLDPIKVF